MQTMEYRRERRRNSYKLRNFRLVGKKVFIRLDMTSEDMEVNKKLQEELRSQRARSKQVKIHGGKIISAASFAGQDHRNPTSDFESSA